MRIMVDMPRTSAGSTSDELDSIEENRRAAEREHQRG
jgi:hypothetical protein